MSKKTLYLECYYGISGDSAVAALIDLGADQTVLRNGLDSLNLKGYKIEISKKIKKGIEACDFNVILEGDHQTEHHHRNLFDINLIIEQSAITWKAKQTAKTIFLIIAQAEAKAHGKPVEEIHFHEVGAIDSIIDIVSFAICFDNLDIQDVFVSELYEGTGQVECQHGMLPVPVPAVVNIISEYQLPIHITSEKGEMVTPTGAGILAAIKTKAKLPYTYQIFKTGLGAGKREFEHANVLRAMLIQDRANQVDATSPDTAWVLETNIDDCSGEVLSAAMEILLENGAKDVFYTPLYMKKNRPAYMLSVICSNDKIEKLEEVIFTHTSTIGIRKHEVTRTTLDRKIITVETPYGNALVKVCSYQNRKFFYPEYDSVKKLCHESGQDYITLYNLVQHLAGLQ